MTEFNSNCFQKVDVGIFLQTSKRCNTNGVVKLCVVVTWPSPTDTSLASENTLTRPAKLLAEVKKVLIHTINWFKITSVQHNLTLLCRTPRSVKQLIISSSAHRTVRPDKYNDCVHQTFQSHMNVATRTFFVRQHLILLFKRGELKLASNCSNETFRSSYFQTNYLEDIYDLRIYSPSVGRDCINPSQ